ncbi:hypothetical protein M513_13567 [Trichuris suis]|uniref:Condensin complex subunit 1 N-terminal domain-containing protein n=2 Tax=Trichuris suis TaxID=68888 RepID=A0A085LKQ5_9BILA|nr:hypothetical protein M513_13567 [Trichuris suis]
MIERMSYGFSFVYPSSLTDVGGCNWNQEFSDEVIAANCLPERFSGFMVDYNRNTSDAIVAHFSVFYSAIRQFDSADLVLVVKMWKVSEFQLSAQGWEHMLDEMPGEDIIKGVRSKLHVSIFLLTNLANLFEDKELHKASSEADNGGKRARGGSRRGGERTANVKLRMNWIHEKKRLLTSYCDILSPQLGKIFESGSSMENMTKSRICTDPEQCIACSATAHAASACSMGMRASPTLRIGILNVYCELVSVKLHGKNLEPRDRKLRNQIAAVMLVPTVNVFRLLVNVRTVYRSICTTLMEVYAVEFFNCNVERLLMEKCIPLYTFRRLVLLVSGRVKDKSVLVRKCALLLFTALVENNPFLVELSIGSISRQTDNVRADLEGLRLLSESMDCTFVFHSISAVVSVLPADCISKREQTEFWNRARNAPEEAVESVHNTFSKEGAFVPTEELLMAIPSAGSLNQDICNASQLISVESFQEAVTEMIAVNKKYANNCTFL